MTETKIEMIPTTENSPKTSTEITNVTEMGLELLQQVDDKISSTFDAIIIGLKEDRERAEEVFLELHELVVNGETHPDTLRELNKAQENIAGTTETLNRFLSNLAKLRQGTDKIQIAQINNESGSSNNMNIGDLIGMMEEFTKSKNPIDENDEFDQDNIEDTIHEIERDIKSKESK